jgi:hypothetical protein
VIAARPDGAQSDALRREPDQHAPVSSLSEPSISVPAPRPSDGGPPAQTLRSARNPLTSLAPPAAAQTAPGVSGMSEAGAREVPSAPEVEVRVAEAPRKEADKTRVDSAKKRPRWPAFALGGGVALAAAAGLAIALLPGAGSVGSLVSSPSQSAWTGKVAAISRAAGDKSGGLSLCDEDGACHDAEVGAGGRRWQHVAHRRAHASPRDPRRWLDAVARSGLRGRARGRREAQRAGRRRARGGRARVVERRPRRAAPVADG